MCERSDVFASACAVARAFPLFTRRSASSRRTEKKHVTVEFVVVDSDGGLLDEAALKVLALYLYMLSFPSFSHIISFSNFHIRAERYGSKTYYKICISYQSILITVTLDNY